LMIRNLSYWRELVVIVRRGIRDMKVDDSVLKIEGDHWGGPKDRYDGNDLTLLAKNYSKSLVSLKISPCRLSKLGKAFRHAVRLEDSDGAYFDKDDEALEFPPNMHCLGIYNMPVTSYPLLLPLVNQLRELNL
ncbi:leucine-rich repeat, cysteine-containing subtype protein, partial [Tanacetum coccineum]